MIPWVLLDRVQVPGSRNELTLYRRGEEFSIRVVPDELMNSRAYGSEEALAALGCAKLAGRPGVDVLIGGLGMGYTAAAVLRLVDRRSRVVVAELVPAVVAWNRGVMAHLAGRPLDDPRVTVRTLDVGDILREKRGAFDGILLDVDNGPVGMTRDDNNWLYSREGLTTAFAALRPGGVLAVWSSGPEREFTRRLNQTGFTVEEHRVRTRGHKGSHHVVWVAVRR